MGFSHVGHTVDAFSERTDYDEPSVFIAENMLRETRRQWGLPDGEVPDVCVLDPDGDIVRHLADEGRLTPSPSWACYHTNLWETDLDDLRIGIVDCAVGAPFAVLVAEQLFASGCQFLVSITSAGQVASTLTLPCMILIDRALRGEGTSDAYQPPSPAVTANPDLIKHVEANLDELDIHTCRGTTWTTDAPYRETQTAIVAAEAAGALAVEMEAAGLYAMATSHHRPIVCFAHVTNTMAVEEGDFEKGPASGAERALRIIARAATGWQQYTNQTRETTDQMQDRSG